MKKENQKTNRYLLETSDTATARLIPLSLNYNQALDITAASVGFRQFVMFALYQLDKDKGHITSARPMMDEFVTKAVSIRDRISNVMGPKTHISTKACRQVLTFMQPHYLTGQYCEIVMDGDDSHSFYLEGLDLTKGQAKQKLIVDTLSVPFLKGQKTFIDNTNQTIGKAIQCYDKMCRAVGATYTPPPGAPFNMINLRPFSSVVRAPIIMPGAIIQPEQ